MSDSSGGDGCPASQLPGWGVEAGTFWGLRGWGVAGLALLVLLPAINGRGIAAAQSTPAPQAQPSLASQACSPQLLCLGEEGLYSTRDGDGGTPGMAQV